MKNLRILSWNVNGLRSIAKKGFLEFIEKDTPDILCIQETKAREEDIPKELKEISGYYSYFSSPERKGYSGVCIYTKEKPLSIEKNFGYEKFDVGRALILEYPDFFLFNIYFPNGKMSSERLRYKMDFYDMFLGHVNNLLNQGKRLIICGDINTAHKEVDIARPKENEKISGFLPEERAWISKFIETGFIDTFRHLRIDYFFISSNLIGSLKSAFILNDVFGSDHCPVGIEISSENTT